MTRDGLQELCRMNGLCASGTKSVKITELKEQEDIFFKSFSGDILGYIWVLSTIDTLVFV
jgi:hypothetical protein